MGHRIAGVWHPEPGDFQLYGLWYPEGDEVTKYMIARLQTEPFYRSDKLHNALTHVKQFRAAVDCGAWVGAWSRELATRFSKVVAIELHPGNTRCIERNCAGRNVQVINCALGESNAPASARRSTYGGTIESWLDPQRVAPVDAIQQDDGMFEDRPVHATPVQMSRLDDVPAVRALGAIDYLKVHVNGAELLVLRGATRTLAMHRPVVTVVMKKALAAFGHDAEDIFQFMRDIDYKVGGSLKPYWTFVPK